MKINDGKTRYGSAQCLSVLREPEKHKRINGLSNKVKSNLQKDCPYSPQFKIIGFLTNTVARSHFIRKTNYLR